MVDDLLKLAKQFDFNMFRQDEEDEEDMRRQSLELLPEEVLESENVDQNRVSAGCGTAAGTDVRLHLDQHMDDDLDFLFDGPTQHVSGNLSQVSSARLSPVSGKPSSLGPASKGTNDAFEDDWENDDLLNDSLVFEMTQNPQNFVSPMHCSTQRAASEVKRQTPANVSGGARPERRETENVGQKAGFKLKTNSSSRTQQLSFSSSKGFSVEAGPRQTCQSKSEPQNSQFHQRASAFSSKSGSAASNTTVTKIPPKTSEVVSSDTTPAVCDFLDEDLDSFFSSDLVWDDPADDSLLCEMCEDVENQIQSAYNVSVKQTLPDVQRAALQPSSRTWDNRTQHPGPGGPTQPLLHKQTAATLPGASGRPAGSSLARPASVTVKDSFRFRQTASGPSSGLQSPAAEPRPASRGQFIFKKPNKPVPTGKSRTRTFLIR